MKQQTIAKSLLLASLLAAAPAVAQEKATGFSLNRFDPSERGSEWFALETLDLRGTGRPAAGSVLDWSHNPLMLYGKNGDKLRPVVEDQLFAHLGASIVAADRVRFALNLPIALVMQGQAATVSGVNYTPKNGAALGDVRLGVDLRLAGEYGDAATAALGVQVHLPSGNADAFTSDGKVRVVPRLMLAGDLGGFVYATRASVNIRTQSDNFGDQPFGSELAFGAALGARLADGNLVIGPEIFGSTVMSDSGDGFFKRKTTPFEVLLGAHYLAADAWRFGAGVGPGLTRGFGSPEVRVLGMLEWAPAIEKPAPAPAPEPSDRDGDGVFDPDDACVDVAGVAAADPKINGCPPLKDTDGDGIFDDKDACVDVAGVKNEDPNLNGCPPDRDHDGIIDSKDACPDEPGEPSDDPALNGCPPPKDTDGDGIFDDKDACIKDAGPASSDPARHGCPKAQIEGGQIKILEQVQFATASDVILPESNEILQAVFKVLSDHTEIKKINIEGHTDGRGARGYNVTLSQRRAASVQRWLVSHGIAIERLSSRGFGPDRPIESNDTDAGRRLNRRVEFHIVEESGSTKE